jgi:hypothetical protein
VPVPVHDAALSLEDPGAPQRPRRHRQSESPFTRTSMQLEVSLLRIFAAEYDEE